MSIRCDKCSFYSRLLFFCHSQPIHSSTSSSWQQGNYVRFGPFSLPVLKHLHWQQPMVGQTVLLCSAVNTAKQKGNATVGVVMWYGEHLPPLLLFTGACKSWKMESCDWSGYNFSQSSRGGNVLPSSRQKYVDWSGDMTLEMTGKTHLVSRKLSSLVWPGH